MSIGFVGAGNMTEALVAALVRAGHRPESIWVSDVSEERTALLSREYGVHATGDNAEVAAAAEVLVLAVKPQQMKAALAGLAASIRSDATVISIAAGVSVDSLREYLGRDDLTIVRAMPNTPALVGAGMSVLFCEEGDGEHGRRAEYLLASCGDTAWVPQEKMLHAVTAISGSGPAYFFLLAEMMQAAATSLGLPEALAEKLVARTAYGAGSMLADTGRTPAQLRQQVTSPGGTTQAALDVMYDKGLPDIVRKAIGAAQKRSVELS